MEEQQLRGLLRFAAFAALPEERMSLAEGALLIADVADAALDHARYHHKLDTLAKTVREELHLDPGARLPADSLSQRATAEHVLACMRDVLAGREGFHGNGEDYYNPRNSLFNEVLDTRAGLPITLSVVYIEVARRLGAPLVGVGLPAHFVAKWPLSPDEGDDLFVDAFAGGRTLDLDACHRFVLRVTSAQVVGAGVDPEWFEPIGPRAVLTRMMHNLKHVYLHHGEVTPALDVVDRLVVLRPDLPEELRDRGLLRLAMGEPLLAAADIAAYAERMPLAPEMTRLRRRLASVGELRAKLN
jgi:regulator of sirC expression with transglutaminase-like and TPR domain